MNAVRVAITGAGGFAASTHRPALTQLGATIVAASRRDIARAKEFTDAVTNPDGTPAVPYDDVARMLRETRPDVVIDASGSGGHVLNATTSLNAGVAYLGEKPIVMTRQEFLELRTLRQRTGVKIGGILQHYYLGVYQRVLEKIQNGSFGRITLWNVTLPWFRTDSYYLSANWRAKKATDGGAFMNQTIHEIGQLILLAAAGMKLPPGETPIESLCMKGANLAHAHLPGFEVEDTGAAILQMKDGSLATISATTGAGGKTDAAKRFCVYGTGGKVEIAANALTVWDFGDPAEAAEMLDLFGSSTSGNASRNPLAVGPAAHAANMAAFFNWVRGGADFPLGLETAALPPVTIEALYESAAKNGAWLAAPSTCVAD